MPQPKKPAEKRQRRNHADVGIVVREVSSSPVPQADQGWREGTVERWVTFWGSPLSRQVEPSDEGAFRRLFRSV
jgi:hypothetical protein